MATGSDHSDSLHDLLTCSICLQTFIDPRHLSCLHTFCKSCIHKFILTLVEKEGTFPCPVCRKLQTTVLKEGKDNETVAETLPVDQFIVSLMDKQAIKRSDKVCNSCEINKLSKKAASWCTICEEALCHECEKYHRSFKMTMSHKIVSICDLQQKNEIKTSEFIVCKNHPTRPIEVYCVDHSNACCTLCGTMSHRKCESVILIEEAARGVKTGKDTTKLLENIDRTEKVLDELVQNRKQNLSDLETESDAISSNISKMKREIIQHLNNIEGDIQTELVAARKQHSLQVTDDVDQLQSQKSALVKWKILIHGVLEHGSETQCLVTLSEMKKKINSLNTELKGGLKKDVRNVSLRYKAMPSLSGFIDTVKSFGNIEAKKAIINVDSGRIRILGTDFHAGDIKVLKTLSVANNGQSSGIFFGDDILVAVHNSKTVVKYSNEFNLLSSLKIQKSPFDIGVIDDKNVVVSCDGEVFIINGKDMTLQRTLELSNIPVFGLCCCGNNQIIVSSSKTLTWVDMTSGAKIKSVKTLGQSNFVLSTGKNDYISGDGWNSISCVVDETKKFTYTNKELNWPDGIGIDYCDNMYISGSDSNNIHQITNDGKLVRIIPAVVLGLTKPFTIRFKQNSNCFIVTCFSSGKASICEIV